MSSRNKMRKIQRFQHVKQRFPEYSFENLKLKNNPTLLFKFRFAVV